MVGWHHQLEGHEVEQAPGVGEGQWSLACCSPWGRKESDTIEWLNWLEKKNILPVISPANVDLFGISRELKFATIASHVQGPSKNEKENSFIKGKRKSGGLCKQRVLGFSLAESFQERSFLFLLGLCYHYRAWELRFLVCRLCSVASLFNNFFQSLSQKAQRWENIGYTRE